MLTNKSTGNVKDNERSTFVLGAKTGMDMYNVWSRGLLKLEVCDYFHCRSLYSSFQIA